MPRRSVRKKGKETTSNATSKGNGKTTTKTSSTVDGVTSDNGVSSRLRPRPQVTSKGNKSPPNNKGKSTNNKNANGNKKNRPHSKLKPSSLDSSVYVSPSGEEYRPGDFAYVDSQHPDQSYHVCLIKDFKHTRRDSMIAEIVWFFRVQEIPESTYLLLLEDRKTSKWKEVFAGPCVKQRELFIAHSTDTHHTSFFRGRCNVKRLEDVEDLQLLISSKDTFFYDLGYSPESRQLTWLNEGNEAYIPYSHQAVIPDLITSKESQEMETDCDDKADPMWNPETPLDNHDLLMYLRAARSIALHAGLWINGYLREGFLAASSDETTQNAYDVLKRKGYNIADALQELAKHPSTAKSLVQEKCWCADDTTSFTRGVKQYGKNFHRIQKEYFPTKHVSELTQYYYYWKKTTVGLSSRAHRRQNKMRHIRLWKQMAKLPPPQQQEREMIDLSSCEEDDEEEYRDIRLYACRQCYARESPTWHHAGPERLLLCQECQLFFFKYGEMPTIPSDRGNPPQVLFKDYHKALHLENLEARRTTRNNGGGQDKDTHSEKHYKSSESGSGDEESASDSETSDDDSIYAGNDGMVSKLQRRKSILTSLPPETNEDSGVPPSKKMRSDHFKEEIKSEDKVDEPLSLQPPCKGTPILSAAGNPSSGSGRVDGRKLGDSPQDDELQCLEPPPNFLRVGKWSSNGETAARTHFEYVHNENAKYIQQKKVTLRTDKEVAQGTPSARTPSTAGHRMDHSGHPSSFTFPPMPGHTPTSMPAYTGSPLIYSKENLRQHERWEPFRFPSQGYSHPMMSTARSSSGSGKSSSQGTQRSLATRPLENVVSNQPTIPMLRTPFDPTVPGEMTQSNAELMQRQLMIFPHNMEYIAPMHSVNSQPIGSFPNYAIMHSVTPEQYHQYNMYQLMAQQHQHQQQQQQQQIVVQLAQQSGQGEPTPIHKPVIVNSTQ